MAKHSIPNCKPVAPIQLLSPLLPSHSFPPYIRISLKMFMGLNGGRL